MSAPQPEIPIARHDVAFPSGLLSGWLEALSNRTAPSALDAMRNVQATATKACDYLQHQHTAMAQTYVEQALAELLTAFHFMGLDVERALTREADRRTAPALQAAQQRVILVFSDHAELRVDGELRGTIPLYSPNDYQEVRQIAALFGCRIEQSDHLQLTLFNGGKREAS